MCSKIPDRYAFDCPCHGYEIHMFCYRAFQMENINLWVRLETTAHELTDEDKVKVEKMMEEQRNGTRSEQPSG